MMASPGSAMPGAFGTSPTAGMPSARATIETWELAVPSSSTNPRKRFLS
jgi:hypothetical protein